MVVQSTTADAADTWREVVALLVEAADRGYRQAVQDPAVHSTALSADLVASAAIALLPPELDHRLDAVTLPDTAVQVNESRCESGFRACPRQDSNLRHLL